MDKMTKNKNRSAEKKSGISRIVSSSSTTAATPAKTPETVAREILDMIALLQEIPSDNRNGYINQWRTIVRSIADDIEELSDDTLAQVVSLLNDDSPMVVAQFFAEAMIYGTPDVGDMTENEIARDMMKITAMTDRYVALTEFSPEFLVPNGVTMEYNYREDSIFICDREGIQRELPLTCLAWYFSVAGSSISDNARYAMKTTCDIDAPRTRDMTDAWERFCSVIENPDLWTRLSAVSMKIGVKDPLCWGDDCFSPQNDDDAQILSPSTIARLGACFSASLAEKACALANILNIDLPDAEPGEPEGSETPIPCGIPVAAIPPESFVQKFAGVYIIELLEILTDQRTVGFLFRKNGEDPQDGRTDE